MDNKLHYLPDNNNRKLIVDLHIDKKRFLLSKQFPVILNNRPFLKSHWDESLWRSLHTLLTSMLDFKNTFDLTWKYQELYNLSRDYIDRLYNYIVTNVDEYKWYRPISLEDNASYPNFHLHKALLSNNPKDKISFYGSISPNDRKKELSEEQLDDIWEEFMKYNEEFVSTEIWNNLLYKINSLSKKIS